MEKVGIVFDKRKPESERLGIGIKQWLKTKGYKVFLKLTDRVLEKGLTFVITLGGDGLVLHTADKVAEFQIPLFRVNFGQRGYLCDVRPNEVFEKLNGDFEIEKRTRIQARVFQGEEIVKEVSALNEIVIGGSNRMISIEMEVRDKEKSFRAKIKGDGVIFSTQTGSTAYNINAGGPVLLTDMLSVVANNALFESAFLLPNTKALVTSTKAVFKVKSLDPRRFHLPYLVADGQRDYKLNDGDLVVIKESALKTLFIKVR